MKKSKFSAKNTMLCLMVGFVLSMFTATAMQTVDPTVSDMSVGITALAIVAGSLVVGLGYESKELSNMATIVCGTITANLGATCQTPATPGVTETLRIYNFDDISGYTFNTNDLIVEAITMNGGALGFTHIGQNASMEPKYETVQKKYGLLWNHQLVYRIFFWDPATKRQIENLSKGKFVAILENNYRGTGGNQAFELYGSTSGLYASSIVREPGGTDESGAFVVTLKTKEGQEEGQQAKTVYITSYTATKTMIDATITP